MTELNSPSRNLSKTGIHKLYETAVEHFDAGDFGQAESCLKKIIDQEPQHGQAYWYLARVKEQKGQFDEALFFWKTCALLNDGSLDWVDGIYSKLADYYTRNGRLQEWYRFLSQAARRNPECVNVQRFLAIAADRTGRKKEAIACLLAALKLATSAPVLREIQEQLVSLCFELSDLETLREAGSSLLESDPRSIQAHYLLSRYYERQGCIDKAVLHLEESVLGEKGPAATEARLELATLYKKAGRPKDALAALSSLALLKKRHPYALWLAAECYEELGNRLKALVAWRKAAEAFGPVSRDGREAFFAYIESLIDLGREEEARNQLEGAPAAVLKSDRARRYLAESCERMGDLATARTIWDEVLSRCPATSRERVSPLLSLCRILLSEGEPDMALRWLEREDLDSLGSADLYGIKAEAHEDLGQEELALLAWERAETLVAHDRRRSFDLKLSRAELLLKLSRPVEAVALLQSTSPRFSREDRYFSLLASALAESGDHDGALLALDRLGRCPRLRVRRDGLLRKAQLLRDLGRLDEAAETFEQIISLGLDMQAGLWGLAEIAWEHHLYEKAQGLWEALAEMYEGSHDLAIRARTRAADAARLAGKPRRLQPVGSLSN